MRSVELDTEAELATAGTSAAELLLADEDGTVQSVGGPAGCEFTTPFADAFLMAVQAELAHPRGWVKRQMRGAAKMARSVRTEPEHGFVELVQNADDTGAHTVRFAETAAGKEVLVVHDGGRVEPHHVLGMTLTLVLTKEFDQDATGKFGIGLKTLNRIASYFEVHCPPYHFAVRDHTLTPVPARPAIPGVYNPDKPETMLVLHTAGDHRPGMLHDWFEQFGADGLMFMKFVRSLQLTGPTGVQLAVTELACGEPDTVSLMVSGSESEAETLVLTDPVAGVRWRRLSLSLPAPADLHRADKETPGRAPFAFAYPDRPAPGALFAGLPLNVGGRLPFHVNALFDPDAARADLLHSDWNSWVVDALTDVACASALDALATDTQAGWHAVPLSGETEAVRDSWLAGRLTNLTGAVQQAVTDRGRIPAGEDGGLADLDGCVPEGAELEDLLDDADVRSLTGAPAVPAGLRDRGGRWRHVLDELDVCEWLEVREAMQLFDADGLDRPGEWHVALAAAGLAAGRQIELRKRRCLLLADGERRSPDGAAADGLLLAAADDEQSRLGAYLNLGASLDPAFLADTEQAAAVRTWLKDDTDVSFGTGELAALEALAHRDPEDPVALDLTALQMLRDALLNLPEEGKSRLGLQIGACVTVDGQTFKNGRAVNVPVRPVDAYLPASFDTGPRTWAKAAARTPGLLWVHSRYQKLLSPGQGRARGARDDEQARAARRSDAARRRTGGMALLTALGAATAPRLVKRPEPKRLFGKTAALARVNQLHQMQREQWPDGVSVPALQDDYTSPDLQAVVGNIAKAKVAEMRPRAAALLRCLDRAWQRQYADRAEARVVSAYYEMVPKGAVPASWVAAASEVAWMTDERKRKRAPVELAIRTPAYEAVVGDDPGEYAYELTAEDADSPVIRSLGFRHQLTASDVLATLEGLRDEELAGKLAQAARVARCYRALADAAPSTDARNARVGDLQVNEVKRRFRAKGGLVRTNLGWRTPVDCWAGRPIFGDRAAFVEAPAGKLWELLGVHLPDLPACTRALRQLAEDGPPTAETDGVLIDTYRHVASLRPDSLTARRMLQTVPLWTGTEWRTVRPVYAVADPALAAELGSRVPVWEPPLRLRELPELVSALKVEVLDEREFTPLGINPGALAAGSVTQSLFRAAGAHFREWLAKHDAALHARLDELPALELARVAVNRGLHVEIQLPGGLVEKVPRRAHVHLEEDQLTFVFADRALAENRAVMGSLLAPILNADATAEMVLALGWQDATDAVRDGRALAGVTLAAEPPAGPEPDGTPTAPVKPTRRPRPAKRPAPRKPRRLKQLDDILAEVGWAGAAPNPEPGSGKRRKEKGLRAPDRDRKPAEGPGTGPPEWTDAEKQRLGLEVLDRYLRAEHGCELTDTTEQDLVGADAIDQHGRFYELKVYTSDSLPDQVKLEPSEFKRADKEKDNFVLAVIAGLEDGRGKVLVRLIPDPLRNLHWEPTVNIVVSGVTRAAALPTEGTSIEIDDVAAA